MSEKKSITERIIADALVKAESAVSEATEQASKLMGNAVSGATLTYENAIYAATKQGAEIVKNRLTLCDLELRKNELAAKIELIDKAFLQAKNTLLKSPDKDYIEIIKNLLLKNASDGDEVIISDKDTGRITLSLIDAVAKERKIKITLAKDTGKFEGGIKLRGKSFDKNLTFEKLFESLREEIEPQVASKLFS